METNKRIAVIVLGAFIMATFAVNYRLAGNLLQDSGHSNLSAAAVESIGDIDPDEHYSSSMSQAGELFVMSPDFSPPGMAASKKPGAAGAPVPGITNPVCNVMYLIEGHNMSALNDVWSFNPATRNWAKVSTSTPMAPREYFGSVVLNNKIFILGGGLNTGQAYNDIWSFDGTAWTQVLAHAPWAARQRFGTVVFAGRIYIFGGRDASGNLLNDVWSSRDGVSWTQVTSHAAWSGRDHFSAVVFNNNIWLAGGYDATAGGSPLNDVWYSPDGIHWVQATQHAGWSARTDFLLTAPGRSLVLVGGYDTTSGYKNDVWASTNGRVWSQSAANAPWAGRAELAGVVFGSRLWISGGASASNWLNDMWSSTDGIRWRQDTAIAPWAVRDGNADIYFPCEK